MTKMLPSEASALQECDPGSPTVMPPPQKRFRIGTPECEEAVRKGVIQLSIEPKENPDNSILVDADEAIDDLSSKNSGDASAVEKLEDSHYDMEEEEEEESNGDNSQHSNNDSNFHGDSAENDEEEEQKNEPQQPQQPNLAPISVVSTDETSTSERMLNDDDELCSMANNASQAGKQFQLPDPNLPRFNDIIGHGHVKLRIEEVLLPMALPTSVTNSILTGVRSMPASILMYGPPGVGKTKLARAIAGEAEAGFLSVGPSDILSKYVGESEASVRALFQKACAQARRMESQCAVLFLDEIDAIGQSRGGGDSKGGGEDSCSRRILAELLLQLNRIADPPPSSSTVEQEATDPYDDDDDTMGGVTQATRPAADASSPQVQVRVIVVAATNRPDDCDPALLRRFGIRIHVKRPTESDRRRILKKLLKDVAHNITKAELLELASALDGWSGSDIENLTREAAMAPVRECIRAAARKKRRARKSSSLQQSDTSSDYECSSSQAAADPHQQARDCLLEGFKTMRPVSLADFEAAIEFWGDNHSSGQGNSTEEQIETLVQHYDSSSGSEDEDEELPGFQRGPDQS